jgi:hypothetical protein
VNRETLKALIVKSLRKQGFRVANGRVSLPAHPDKQMVRALHADAVQHKIARSEESLRRLEPTLLTRIASGGEVVPDRIMPELVEVEPNTENELLFRYASLHWSVPTSSGYGRRLRFIVTDKQNGKLIGILGLGDPVFRLADRDAWIGWSAEAQRENLRHVMDAFVLGAVPPYSFLLCGKLTAMLAASNEVREAFRRKYGGSRSLILQKRTDGRLALITTSSALGRSSIYNRVKYRGRLVYQRIGFTRGSGEFHFSNGLYSPIQRYAARYCEPTAKQDSWGSGFRNRREVIKKCLAKIGLPKDWLYHGIRREIFAVPLANNSREFLRGQQSKLLWYDMGADDLFAFFRDRYLLPRSQRDDSYKSYNAPEWAIWCARSSAGGTNAGKTHPAHP